MTELDDLMGEAQTSPVTFNDILGTPLDSIKPPLSASRNRAATLALTAEPDSAMQNYQIMLSEAENGEDKYTKHVQSKVEQAGAEMDRTAAFEALADPRIPMERKAAAIEFLKLRPTEAKDTSQVMYGKLAANASEGETPDEEDARINATSRAIKSVYESRTTRQHLINAHGAGLRSVGAGTLAEAAALAILPFGTNIAAAREAGGTGGAWDVAKAFLAPGSFFKGQRQALENLPLQAREEAIRNALKNLEQTSGIIFSDNDFQEFQRAQQLLAEGGYSDVDVWLDNLTGILDIVGIGQVIKGVRRSAKAAEPVRSLTDNIPSQPFTQPRSTKPAPEVIDLESLTKIDESGGGWVNVIGGPVNNRITSDTVDRIRLNAPVGVTNPLSPHGTAKQTNPEKARETFETILNSEGDAIAEGLAGASKNDTIASDIMPKAVTESGAVAAEPVDIQRKVRRSWLPESVVDFFKTMGRVDFTAAEKASMTNAVVRSFRDVAGLTMHESMGGFKSTFTPTGGVAQISAIYGKSEGAWSSAQDAIAQTVFALRKNGITEDQITLMKHDGLDYVPVKLEDVKDEPGSYMTRVTHEHKFSYSDITNSDPTNPIKFEGITTKLNFLDRMPISFKFQGGLSAWILDAASKIDPKISHATTSAIDYEAKFEKLMLEEAAKFSDQYVKLSKDAKARVDNYIMDANFNQTKMNPIDMSTRLGMSQKEIDAVKAWRDFWDGQFYLENADLVRQFNEQGFQLFRNGTDEFYVKPVTKNQNIGSVYDPATQSIVRLTKDEMDALYLSGGNYARFRRPVNIQGQTVDHMIVRNTPTEFTRKFNDTDMVLNYREGYFTIHYDKPRFVDEITTDANGNEVRRAVAVAKDSVDAADYVTRANKSAAPGVRYEHRADDRALRRSSDDWFDLESARGRIAQRHRGKNLEGSDGTNQLDARQYIEDPVTSAIKSAQSIAGRVVTRPVLETAKQRVMSQFGHLFPSDGMGGRKWPTDVSEIGKKGGQVTPEVADARTNWAHINYLDNGYINGVDQFYKQQMQALAEKLGEKGFGSLQRGADNLSDLNPTHGGKQVVFTAFIASHFMRQFFIQAHQVVRTFAYNPRVWTNGNILNLPKDYLLYVAGGRNPSVYKSNEFVRFVEDSGIMAAVDKHSLVRDTLIDATHTRSLAGKAWDVVMGTSRKIGFDMGERANMLGHMAAVYDKYKRLGRNMNDPDVKAQAMSEARAITGEMNFAGDMPYNQTSVALFAQFLQVPHKFALVATNRKLSPAEKMRIIAFDMAMWGPPILLVNAAAEKIFGEDILPEDPKARDMLVEGLESYYLNKMFRDMTGKSDIDIDFSSLAPYDYMGFVEMMHAFYDGGLSQLIDNSPAGRLLLSEQGRARIALNSAIRFMRIQDHVGESPDTFMQVLKNTAQIASGFNDPYKAYLMLETYKRYDAYGKPTGDMQHAVEAFAQALGFGNTSQKRLFELSKAVSETAKGYEDEVKNVHKSAMRFSQEVMNKGLMNPEQLHAVNSFLISKYKNDPVALRILDQQTAFALRDPNEQWAYQILRYVGMPGLEDVIPKVKMLNVPEEDKQRVIKLIQDAKAYRESKEEN